MDYVNVGAVFIKDYLVVVLRQLTVEELVETKFLSVNIIIVGAIVNVGD